MPLVISLAICNIFILPFKMFSLFIRLFLPVLCIDLSIIWMCCILAPWFCWKFKSFLYHPYYFRRLTLSKLKEIKITGNSEIRTRFLLIQFIVLQTGWLHKIPNWSFSRAKDEQLCSPSTRDVNGQSVLNCYFERYFFHLS